MLELSIGEFKAFEASLQKEFGDKFDRLVDMKNMNKIKSAEAVKKKLIPGVTND